MRLALVLVATLLLAGCTKPDQAIAPPVACLGQFAGEPGQTAVLLGALQDDPEALAARVAGVAGDNLTGPPQDVDGTLRFRTERGHVDYTRAGEADKGRFSVEWVGTPTWGNESEADVTARLLAELQFAGETKGVAMGDARPFVQVFEGEAIVGSGGTVRASGTLRVGPLYEVRFNETRISEEEANETARAFGLCELGGEVTTQRAGWLVRRDSLAHAFRIEREGECGAVAVDAETGAIHEYAGC